MKKVVSGSILVLIGVLLVASIFLFVDLQDTIYAILNFSLLGFFVISILTFLSFVIGAWRMRYILKHVGCDISFWSVLNAWLAGHAFNYVTPFVFVGGEGVKAYILKEKFHVPWDKGAASLTMDRILDVTMAFLVVAIALASFVFLVGLPGLNDTASVIFGGTLLVGLLIGALYFAFLKKKKFISSFTRFFSFEKTRFGLFLKSMEHQTIKLFSKNLKVMWYSLFISFLKQVVVFLRQVALFYYIVKNIELLPSLLSLGVLYISFLVPLPGALGFQEVFQVLIFPIVGFAAGEGLALSLVLRGAGFLFVAVGIYTMFYYGIKLTFWRAKSYN